MATDKGRRPEMGGTPPGNHAGGAPCSGGGECARGAHQRRRSRESMGISPATLLCDWHAIRCFLGSHEVRRRARNFCCGAAEGRRKWWWVLAWGDGDGVALPASTHRSERPPKTGRSAERRVARPVICPGARPGARHVVNATRLYRRGTGIHLGAVRRSSRPLGSRPPPVTSVRPVEGRCDVSGVTGAE